MIESNRVDILVEDERKRDSKVEDVETLRTDRERQNLDGVRDNKRGERNAVHQKNQPTNRKQE